MKRLKEILAAILTLLLIASSVPLSAFADTAISGTTGDCAWTYDGTTLTISGNGRMADCNDGADVGYIPWSLYSEDIQSVVIEPGVKNIGHYAFRNQKNLTSVSIPNSVTSIGAYSFFGCESLTSITFPDSVVSIGHGAFSKCSNFKRIDITDLESWCKINYLPNLIKCISPNGQTYYIEVSHGNDGNECFAPLEIAHSLYLNGKKITDLVIPDGTTAIGGYAFAGGDFKSVTIPNSVEYIRDSAFSGCTGLKSATIPNGATSIGSKAFYGCTGLTSITIPNRVTSIGSYAFYGCTGLKSATIPEDVERSAFYGCKIKNLTIANGAKKVTSDMIYNCRDTLEKVIIPNSVAYIDDDAFDGCTKLKAIYLPNRYLYIDDGAFANCTELTIYGAKGSFAERYAERCNIPFACSHETEVKSTKATTAKDGSIAKVCKNCKQTVFKTTIAKVSNVKVNTASFIFDGKVKTPAVTVNDSNGKALKSGTDYTVTYAKGRKNVGKYKVTVTLKGNYSGTKTLSFTIVPKGTKLSSVKPNKKQITAKWKSQKSQTSGYQVQYSISKNFKGAKTVTVNSNKTTSKTIKKLKGGKKYYVRVRTFKKVGGKKYYSSWSGSKTAKTKR